MCRFANSAAMAAASFPASKRVTYVFPGRVLCQAQVYGLNDRAGPARRYIENVADELADALVAIAAVGESPIHAGQIVGEIGVDLLDPEILVHQLKPPVFLITLDSSPCTDHLVSLVRHGTGALRIDPVGGELGDEPVGVCPMPPDDSGVHRVPGSDSLLAERAVRADRHGSHRQETGQEPDQIYV